MDSSFYPQRKEVTFPELKAKVRELLCLKDDHLIDIVCATYLSYYMGGDPLWTMLVGPPASGKSEMIMALAKCPDTHVLSDLTPSTFASGWEAHQMAKGKKPKADSTSFLKRFKNGVILMKDFGTLLSQRQDSQRAIIGQMREVYDGMYTKEWGTGKTFSWEGNIVVLAGGTMEIYRRHSMLNDLGPRFLYYRVKNYKDSGSTEHAFETYGREKAIRRELQTDFQAFLTERPRATRPIKDERAMRGPLCALAELVARARTVVWRDRNTKVVELRPEPEGSHRVVKELRKAVEAVAQVYGVTVMTDDVLYVARKTAIDSIPNYRWDFIQWFWDQYRDGHTEKALIDVENELHLPRATAKLHMDDLTLLEVFRRDHVSNTYSLSDWSIRKLNEGRVF